ncbi:hypothetical protein CALVIDRAFT_597898 [Calocera viscosa TUFC12733]|uniref:Histone H1 n=1 Tax=Calocera viscosa (strain TUFC12733) TaxID=1330018 RepID=A0A167MZJ1_CALVF|nr:hypothetical protein CALVIDRAFT_597898 [Calocera viscosa TUFC12733]
MNDALFHQLQLGNSTNWGIDASSFPNPNPQQQPPVNGEAQYHEPTLEFPSSSRPSIIELKRRFLTQLTPSRLVSTILDLELRGLRHDPSFGAHMWPPDLEAAVRDMEDGRGEGETVRPPRALAGPSHGKAPAGRPLGRPVDGEREAFHPGSNGLPNYEEMIVEALYELGGEDGLQPKVIFDWIAERYPINSNFRPSAHQAIQKSHKRGRLEKTGNKYRLNPDWDGTILTKKPTRRPKPASDSAPALPVPSTHPPAPAPAPTPAHLQMPTASMSIEAALSMLVNGATAQPVPVYTPPTDVQQSLNSLAQQFAARSRKGRTGDVRL